MAVITPIGVAIIGGGIFVKTKHLPAVLACRLLSLKAIWSRSLKSAQDTAALIKDGAAPDLYSSEGESGYDDLLKREDIQAVIIALPILKQPEYAEKALAAGKHVLLEKPMAEHAAAAKALIARHEEMRAAGSVATLSVAENFRFYPSFAYAAGEARKMGRVTHFSVRVMFRVDERDNEYYQTEWRKHPGYQGGFLLDAGVHFAAGARLLLSSSEENEPVEVTAFSAQVEPHLPPVDSLAALIRTRGGAAGVFQFSAGTLASAFEWDFSYRGGNVKLSGDEVTVKHRGEEETMKKFERTSGVGEEVAAWARGIAEGRPDELQASGEAVNDIEFMEKMFRSGEQDGAPQRYQFV